MKRGPPRSTLVRSSAASDVYKRQICRYLWPQIDPEENPMAYVTNGVHLPTFLATEWHETFERYLGIGWQEPVSYTHLTLPTSDLV